jgi:hypothetical protein
MDSDVEMIIQALMDDDGEAMTYDENLKIITCLLKLQAGIVHEYCVWREGIQ